MSKLETVNIKGKEYVMVNERIKAFRENFKGYSLETELIDLTPEVCTMRAVVKDENRRIIATGFAQEEKSSSYINKTSYIENCETSAWGRALGNLGIGVDTSICSAEELSFALSRQNELKDKAKSEKAAQEGLDGFQSTLDKIGAEQNKPVSDKTLSDLTMLLFETQQPEKKIYDKYGITDLKELTEELAQKIINRCKEIKEEKKC